MRSERKFDPETQEMGSGKVPLNDMEGWHRATTSKEAGRGRFSRTEWEDFFLGHLLKRMKEDYAAGISKEKCLASILKIAEGKEWSVPTEDIRFFVDEFYKAKAGPSKNSPEFTEMITAKIISAEEASLGRKLTPKEIGAIKESMESGFLKELSEEDVLDALNNEDK